jgi:drug/metabolite transporter (DMT)-like permease
MLAVSAVSFGALPVFGKLAYAEGMNVQSLLTARFLLAGVLLGAYVIARRTRPPAPRIVVGLVLLGALGYVGQSAAYFTSIRFVPAAVTSILLYTYPAIVTVASVRLYGAPMNRGRVLAVLLALAGCILVASPSGRLNPVGVALGLVSAAVYSTYILSGKKVMETADPWLATAVIAFSAGCAYLAFGVGTRTLHAPPTPRAWLWVAGLAIVSTVLGAGLFLAGLKRTDPGRASLISTLEPVSTTAMAFVVLGQGLGPGQLVGGALVLGAVALVALSPGGGSELPSEGP